MRRWNFLSQISINSPTIFTCRGVKPTTIAKQIYFVTFSKKGKLSLAQCPKRLCRFTNTVTIWIPDKSGIQMVDFCLVSNGRVFEWWPENRTEKKPVYSPKCWVFEWFAKSNDFTIWIPGTHTVRYSGVRYSGGYCKHSIHKCNYKLLKFQPLKLTWLSTNLWMSSWVIFASCSTTTYARGTSPSLSSGTPITATSSISGMERITSSSSAGGTWNREIKAELRGRQCHKNALRNKTVFY